MGQVVEAHRKATRMHHQLKKTLPTKEQKVYLEKTSLLGEMVMIFKCVESC